ncbi:sigma-54-dependent transcriptional regulator [Gracilinema caldarium]|uniref:Two component, sigma54 specific, transcriptional regulator n=1 Tax=Gracilinema caldarium (strain ATCC 51460 / DSM 7334 / H1) TaxID=744872 RepID=F8EY20_GRAC1|nr:sigma-54 dependent transcriptional regulator [Gracilinema caldarium]AEJ20681.1 putative two component, sigma54 specific, transcriptional regulator [Gracilinema caldarium DSM 7334]
MNTILVIDDESGIRTALSSILMDEGYHVETAEDALIGLTLLEQHPFELIFLDVLLPRLGGLEALEKIKTGWPDIEVVMISGHANVDMAVRAVKLGAFDFLEKPLSLDKVLTVTKNALTLQKLRQENISLKKGKKLPYEEIIGHSPGIRAVKERIEQAAQSDARVLITGENGTGKELVVRAIHYKSSRADKPLIEVNCAAIPDTLIESELFGHEKGAFTDAVSSRRGRFEMAHRGTLFLDEIGDMTLTAQAKVLRALQEQKIERLGSEQSLNVDVRVIAATNKDLEAECQAGRFREDLFFRLNVIPIHIPPLRERKEDIPELLMYFLHNFSAEDIHLSEKAMEYLTQQPWPGNVRELKNFAERLSILCETDTIELDVVQNILGIVSSTSTRKSSDMAAEDRHENQRGLPAEILELDYNEAKDLFEKRYLEYKLSENGYIISRTAEVIGMYPSNLHAKIKKHGIRMER